MFDKCIMCTWRVPHVYHRHVFRLFNMKCMPATVNAYSLHLYIYDRCGVCARLTCLFLEVSTHTHWHAHTHWGTHEGAAMATSVSLTLSSLLPTGRCGSLAISWYHCRTQSSAASAPWSKWTYTVFLSLTWMTFRNNTWCYVWNTCVWVDFTSVLRCAFESIWVWCIFTSCVDRIPVCLLCLCGKIYTYHLHVCIMAFEFFIYSTDIVTCA